MTENGFDRISAEKITEALADREWTVEVHEALDSTNNRAKQLAQAGVPGKTVILAEVQSAGRGRLGRSFCSPAGTGIYMSILLRPDCPVQDATHATTFAAVAAARAIDRFCDTPVDIKWVNDLYMNGKKICGILTEAATDPASGRLDYLVVGIGINVRKTVFPPELQEIAGTIEEQAGVQIDRAALVAAILEEFSQAETGFDAAYMEEYRARSLILGKQVTVLADPPYDALAVAIDDDASLVVETEGGTRRISAGEVSIRNWR